MIEVTTIPLTRRNKNSKMRKIILILFGCFIFNHLSHAQENLELISKGVLRGEFNYNDYSIQIYRDEKYSQENVREISTDVLNIFKKDSLVYSTKGSYQYYRYNGYLYSLCKYGCKNEDKTIDVGMDVTGDGEPNLIICEWDLDAPSTCTYIIFSIGNDFRRIDEFKVYCNPLAEGTVAGFKDLDGDGSYEFIMRDRSVSPSGFVDGPVIVLRYHDGKYIKAQNLIEQLAP